MKYLALCLSLSMFSLSVSSTAYSWGDYKSWLPRIKAANEYIAKRYSEKESMSVETRESAMYVIGFVEGMRDGIVLHEIVKLKQQFGDDIPKDAMRKITAGICLEETYSKIIFRLSKFIDEREYRPGHDFMSIYLDFVIQEYSCK